MDDMNVNKDPLKEMMKKSILKMPFSDFEATVMHRIRNEKSQKSTLSRDLKLSFLFFILGTAAGLTVYSILQNTAYPFLGIPSDTSLLIFLTGFVLLFLFQLEKNLHLIRLWRKQQRR